MSLNLDRACPHEDFDASVSIIRLEDTGKFQCDVRVWCLRCDEPFTFPQDILIGIDLNGVARNVDGTELRVAVKPRVDTPEPLTEE